MQASGQAPTFADAVARRVRLDQAADQGDVDQFDPDARARNGGQRCLHLGIVVLTVGGAHGRGGIAGRFRQLTDVAGRKTRLRAPAPTSALMPASA